MPIPFREDGDLDRLGHAAYLRVVRDGDSYLGALFLVNGRGEPVEFSYNRIDIVQRFLWRQDELARHAARRLTASLFEICPRVPSLLLCRADEVPGELFSQDLRTDIPSARIADEGAVVGQGPSEEREMLGADVQVFWSSGVPGDADAARALVDQLAGRSLLLEPFERALVGLREVYGGGETANGVVG